MKIRSVVLSVMLFFVAAAVCLASNPFIGTWKLNEAKSKISPGSPKNTTVVYEVAGDQIKITVDGVDGEGKPTHNEWTGKFDGKCYAVTGDPTSDKRCYKVINSRTLRLTGKMGSKLSLSGTIAVSANGKVRTVTTSGTDAKGKKFKNTYVYDKE